MAGRSLLWVTCSLIVVVPFLLAVATGSAFHACNLQTCGGSIDVKTDTEIFGGNGQPLKWRSVNRLEHGPRSPGEPEYRCYEREIKNEPKSAVTDVVWQVANFYRRIIPGETTECEPTPALGSSAQKDGPIVYGATSTPAYQTRIWVPQEGWPGGSARYHILDPSAFVSGTKLELGGSIRFYSSADKGSVGTVRVTSTVDVLAGSEFRYTYKVEGKAAEPIQVQWGVLKDAAELRDSGRDFVLSPTVPLRMGKERTVLFVLSSKTSPKWGAGTIVIKDQKGGILAKGMVTSFGPSTGSIVEPE